MFTKEAREDLVGIGKVAATNFFKMLEEEEVQTEKVASIAEKVSDEDMEILKQAEVVGEGMAIGYEQGVQNTIKEASDNLYTAVISTIAKVAEDKNVVGELSKLSGEEFATYLHNKIAEEMGEDPETEEALKAEIAKGVAPVVVEAVGGEEALEQMAQENPEALEEVKQTVEAITEQAKEELMEAAMEEEAAAQQQPQGQEQPAPQPTE